MRKHSRDRAETDQKTRDTGIRIACSHILPLSGRWPSAEPGHSSVGTAGNAMMSVPLLWTRISTKSASVAQPLPDLDVRIRRINDALTLLRPRTPDSPAVFSVFLRYTKTVSYSNTSYNFYFPSNHGVRPHSKPPRTASLDARKKPKIRQSRNSQCFTTPNFKLCILHHSQKSVKIIFRFLYIQFIFLAHATRFLGSLNLFYLDVLRISIKGLMYFIEIYTLCSTTRIRPRHQLIRLVYSSSTLGLRLLLLPRSRVVRSAYLHLHSVISFSVGFEARETRSHLSTSFHIEHSWSTTYLYIFLFCFAPRGLDDVSANMRHRCLYCEMPPVSL